MDDFDINDFEDEEEDDEDEDIIYENDEDGDEAEIIIPEEKPKKESEDEEEDSDDENSENEITEIKSSNIVVDKYKYKYDILKKFSKNGMIALLCNVVEYIKKGGKMLDNRTENDFEYPDETEESYAIESILMDTIPFIYIHDNKKIDIDIETRIITMKLALRPVDENKKIFFTKKFIERYPIFTKNLSNNYVTQDEILEVENNKKIFTS